VLRVSALPERVMSRRNEPRHVTNGRICSVCEQVKQFLLIRWFDPEYVDERDEIGVSAIVVMKSLQLLREKSLPILAFCAYQGEDCDAHRGAELADEQLAGVANSG